MSAANVELVRSSFAAINDRDVDAILAHFSDDVVFDGSRVMEGVYHGKDSFRGFLEALIESATLEYRDLSFLEDGDRVIALGTIHGRGPQAQRRWSGGWASSTRSKTS